MNHAQHSARNNPNKISLVIVLPPDFLKFPLQLSIIYAIMIMQGGGKCRLGIVFCFWKSYLLSKASIFLIISPFQ